jgi:hypothetical protein
MKNLRELKDWSLDHPDEAIQALEMADEYLQMYDRLGDKLVIPKEHAFARPVVEYFAGAPEEYAKWLRKLVDDLPKSEARRQCHELFRRVNMRHVQRVRRERIGQAVHTAVNLGIIPDEYLVKERYARRCTLVWGAKLKALQNAARASNPHKRLSHEEDDMLREDFWSDVEAQISRGELPEP